MIDREKFKALAKEREALEGANKDRIAAFDLRAQDAGIDPAGLKRFVAWKRQDEQRRAQKEAIDQQCRYLAGERDTPAELPIGCELAQAINLYRRNMTVRQVADELNISSGKAGKLRELARMFVHVHDRVDKPKAKKPPTVVTPPEVAALPAHNVETGEITDSRAVEDDDGEQAGRGGATDGRHSVDPPMASKPESEAGLAGEAEAPAPITETAPDTPPSPAPEFGVGPGTNLTGESNGEEDAARQPDGVREESPVCRKPDAEDAGGDADAVRGSGDGQDDHREDDFGASGEGQAELAPPPPNADGMDIPSFLRRSA